MFFSSGRAEVIFKYSIWKWKITDDFNLNMSFVFFQLQYSGEACLQERVVINSERHRNIGRYCGRRHYFSVFTSSMPIALEFFTHELSWSKFILNYQLTNKILSTIHFRYTNENSFSNIEHTGFVYPFSWIHKYCIAKASYYMWNTLVPKMFKVFIKVLKAPTMTKSLVFFDGPDFQNKYYAVDTKITFAYKYIPNVNFLFETIKKY